MAMIADTTSLFAFMKSFPVDVWTQGRARSTIPHVVIQRERFLPIVAAACLVACEGSPEPQRADLQTLLDTLRRDHDIPGAVLAVQYPNGEVDVFASGTTRLGGGRAVDIQGCS